MLLLASVIPVMSVARAIGPVPLVLSVNVTACVLVAPPSVTSAVPVNEIGRASCRDRVSISLAVGPAVEWLEAPVRLELNDSGHSTSRSSPAVSLQAVVALRVSHVAGVQVLAV